MREIYRASKRAVGRGPPITNQPPAAMAPAPFAVPGRTRGVSGGPCARAPAFSRAWRRRGNAGVSRAAPETGTAEAATRAFFDGADDRPIVLFDGECMLCNGGVDFMLNFDTEGRARFAALQSSAGRDLLVRAGRQPDDISSIVLVESDTTAHVKSDAILRIARLLDAPLPVLAPLGFLVPQGVRDGFYDWVSENRYSFFGKSENCRLRDANFNDRFLE